MENTVIRSFEESFENIGDILTKGKEKKKIKIGLLTCGYFEYWRMYPQLKEKVNGDIETITRRLHQDYENILPSGMVDTLEKAQQVSELFKKEGIDAILLVYGTYIPDFISLTVLDCFKNSPLVIFSTQVHSNVDLDGNYEGSLRNSGLIGVAQITGTLRKMERKFHVVVGSSQDERAYKKIRRYFSAVQAVEDLREANIGIIGHVFRGMYDIELSKTFLKKTFGVNLIVIQASHLLDIWKTITDESVNAQAEKLVKRFRRKNITDQDVFNAVKLALAMREVADRFHLDAMCFLDQHFVQKQVRASARIGGSLLMEETDICVNCEGDIGGLVTMMLMKSISGKSPLMGEWGEYDEATNSCLIIGHGIGTPDLASSDQEISITRTPEEWGFEGSGMNYELIVKPGAATIGHIMETMEGYRLLCSPVESIEFPKLNFDEIHALVRTKTPIKEYLEQVLDYGVSHHCILGLGDISEELLLAAELLNLKKFVIE